MIAGALRSFEHDDSHAGNVGQDKWRALLSNTGSDSVGILKA